MISAIVLASFLAVADDGKVSAEELVRRLGDTSFRVRDASARELLARGAGAIDALKRGGESPDPEVRDRCRRLLTQLQARLIRERLEAFVKDAKAPPDPVLPAADRFLTMTGSSKAARALYVEMLRENQALLEALVDNPKQAAELCQALCKSVQERARLTGRRRTFELDVSRAELGLMLVASADSRVTLDSVAAFHRSIALKTPHMAGALAKEDDPLRRLFVAWLEREPDASALAIGLELAAGAQMKETFAVVVKVANDARRTPTTQATALLFLPRLGDKSNIKDIAALLDNKTGITAVTFGEPDRRKTTVELGDVALGVAITLAGRDPTDFGFDIRRPMEARSYVYYGFPSPKERAAAHAQWRQLPPP